MTDKPKLSPRLRQVYEVCCMAGVFDDGENGYYLRSFPGEVLDILRDEDPPITRAEIEAVIEWSGMHYYRRPRPEKPS